MNKKHYTIKKIEKKNCNITREGIILFALIGIIAGCGYQLKKSSNSACCSGLSDNGTRIVNTQKPSGPILDLPVHFYRNYPIDYNATIPAEGTLGWGSETMPLPLNETALIVMHGWNLGLDNDLPWPPTGHPELIPHLQMTEWIKRYRNDINQMQELLNRARKAGMPIVHIASFEGYCGKYKSYWENKKAAGSEPARPLGSVRSASGSFNWWAQEHIADTMGPGLYTGDSNTFCDRLHFAPQLEPMEGEGVVTTTYQLNHWLRARGLSNLIYTGFAINVCLWFMPCGMVDMSRLDYRCFAVEECVGTVESKESAPTLANKKYAMWQVSLNFGYVLHKDELEAALDRATGRN